MRALPTSNTGRPREKDLVTHSLELRRRGRALLAVTEVAKHLLGPANPTPVLEEILTQIQRLFGYPICAIFLVDQASGELYVKAQRGHDPNVARALRVGVGEPGIPGDVLRSGPSHYIARAAKDPRYVEFTSAARSHVVLPLIVDRQAIGLLSVGSPDLEAFPEEVREALQAFASLASLAIVRAQQDDELHRLALTDGLTELANYRALVEVLDREIARAGQRGYALSLVVVEIDKFKRINDRYGHLRGDEVLRAVGNVLRGTCRKGDLAARFGGDEFMLLLPYASKEAAVRVAERARRQAEALALPDDIRLTVSLGVASLPADGSTADALLDAADQAMYQVKRAGGNGVGAYVATPSDPKIPSPSRHLNRPNGGARPHEGSK